MDSINELLQAVYISLLVARFLLNSSRVLKAIELLKECLILLNNKALKKLKVLVTPYKYIYHQMFDGYLLISDWPNAIECGRKLLVLLRESGERNKEEEVKVTFRLAELHQKQGKYQEAKKSYEEALGITKHTGDREGEAVCHGMLGFVCHHLGEYAKAKEYHEKALAFTKEIGDRGYEASCYIKLGNVFQSLGGKEKAKEYYEKALAIATEIGKREKEASCYRNLGSVSGSLGDYTKAKEYYEKALAIATEIGNRGHKAFCYQNLGTVFRILGENARAREYLEKALAIAKEIGDRKQESCCYERLGAVFHVLGKYDTAKEYHEKGLTIAKEIGDGKNKASCYRGLGNVFTSVGDYVKAKENYEKALAIAKEIGERGEEITCNRYLGTVFLHLGEYAKAKTFYENALAMAKEISDGKSKDVCRAVCYGGLGTMFYSLGEHAKAKEYHEIALTITKEIGDRQKEANCYGELGSVFGSLGEYAKAREFYEKALAIAKEIGDRKKEGTFYGNLGVLFHYLGEYAKAKKYYDKVLVISKEIGCIKLEQATHANFAMTMLSEGNIHEAQSHLLASIDKFESIRSLLTGYDQLNISLFDENVLAYQILGSLFCVTGNPVQALYVVELGRARALADLMSAQYSIENKVSVNPQTRVGIANIMKNESNCTCLYISYYAEMIYLWTFKGDKPIRFRKIDVDHCFVHKASTRSVDEVLGAKTFRQLHLLAEEQCEDRSWLPSNVIRPTCKSSQEDSLAASRLVEKEEYENQQPDPTLAECYKMIITPVADLLDEAEIIIVPDRCFFKVPFTALEDESRNCLSETFRIRIIPSLTCLKLIQESPVDYHSQTGALIVGDPDVGEVFYKGRREKPLPLPCARGEAEMIGELLGVDPLLKKQATKQAVLESIGSVSLIHFAAHGDAERGEIVLAPPPLTNRIPREEDYLLTMSDISQVRLRAKLVVLSCCHSAHGEIRAEGVVGIARAFLGSGARSVLVALWAIEDKATEQFMSRFYEHLVSGESASESLHQAMKWMRSNGFSKEGQWAPFMLIGDNVTFDFKNKRCFPRK